MNSIFSECNHSVFDGCFLNGARIHIFYDQRTNGIINDEQFVDHRSPGVSALGTGWTSDRFKNVRPLRQSREPELLKLKFGRSMWRLAVLADSSDQSLCN